jgi:hypothetical protein
MTRSFARIALYLVSLLAAIVAALVYPDVAKAGERVYLNRADIEASLLDKGVASRNLASGTLSHWQFHRDGTVDASRSGLGKASGTWTIQDDGKMCVTMLNRTGCRYWFRNADAFANADTRAPDAPVVAEVRFE